MEHEDKRKVHRVRQAGRKAEKKKAKDKHEQDLSAKQRNPRAFAIQSANKTAKRVQRWDGALSQQIKINLFKQW